MPVLRFEDKSILFSSEFQNWAVEPAGFLEHWWAVGFTCAILAIWWMWAVQISRPPSSPSSPLGTASKLGLSWRWLQFFFFFLIGARFLWQMVRWDVLPYSITPELLFNLLLRSHVTLSCSMLFIFLSEVCVLNLVARLAWTDAEGGDPGGN